MLDMDLYERLRISGSKGATSYGRRTDSTQCGMRVSLRDNSPTRDRDISLCSYEDPPNEN